MKKKVFLFCGVMISSITFGQQSILDESVNSSPTFRSGKDISFEDFLRESIQFPDKTYHWGDQGTVVIGFIVAANGDLKDFNVINGVSNETEREVIRVIKSTNGRWMPGRVGDKPVDMQQEVSVMFKLYPNLNFVALARTYLQKGNQMLFVENKPNKALALFNRGMRFLPNDMSLLAIRSFCKQCLGDVNGANNDLERINLLAERNGTNLDLEILAELLKDSKNINDFHEFRNIVEK